ncbi:MAG: ankyrin repeat domain-containing protein [archaeon]|nr:MAG: ankyrin repeat domain-containing protein [archaeon]
MGHGNLPRVKAMLEENPSLLNVVYQWGENDFESAIQAAAQTGAAPVAEFLLEKGAPLSICTAAMLGKKKVVEEMLSRDPSMSEAVGAHGIPLLPHAALSGDVELCRMVWDKGATKGATLALHNAVSRGRAEATAWLLENASPSLEAKNYEGKTALVLAEERKMEDIAALIRQRSSGS